MNSNYKSIETVINRILRNPLMNNITEADLAQMVGDAIKLIGAPKAYEDKSCDIEITNYRGKLPLDMIYIIQSSWKEESELDSSGNPTYYPMRVSTSTYATQYHMVGSPDFNQDSNYSYSLNNHYIYTDAETGTVTLVYKALVTDEKGFPMIPDNIKFERAVEQYVKYKHYEVLWELGKISDKVFDYNMKEWEWAVGAAQSAGQLQTIDEAESFANAFSRLLLKPLQHQEFFVNHGARQYFKENRI